VLAASPKETTEYRLTYYINDVEVNLSDVSLYMSKEGNVYTFYKEEKYVFRYAVTDYKGNIITKDITINVEDNKGPNIYDPNKYVIEERVEDGERYFVIGETTYILSKLEVVDNVFKLNGREYRVYEEYVMLSGINYNDNKICFVGECENKLLELEARDEQDGKEVAIRFESIGHSKEYSTDPRKYGKAEYENKISEGMFGLESITLKKTGYYRIVMIAQDSQGNVSEVVYIIRVNKL
jgi:hypothetical protein